MRDAGAWAGGAGVAVGEARKRRRMELSRWNIWTLGEWSCDASIVPASSSGASRGDFGQAMRSDNAFPRFMRGGRIGPAFVAMQKRPDRCHCPACRILPARQDKTHRSACEIDEVGRAGGSPGTGGAYMDASEIECARAAVVRDAVSHRLVTALALVPHAPQRRVAGIDEVDDPHAGLAGVLAVQAASVLL